MQFGWIYNLASVFPTSSWPRVSVGRNTWRCWLESSLDSWPTWGERSGRPPEAGLSQQRVVMLGFLSAWKFNGRFLLSQELRQKEQARRQKKATSVVVIQPS